MLQNGVLAVLLLIPALPAVGADFAATVVSTKPVAFYRLTDTSGKSQVGETNYNPPNTGARKDSPGPVGGSFVRLDGRQSYLLSTQSGGVTLTASIMAWVNLASLPSKEQHMFYVAGESQYGNDLDLQFETDNALKFFTASGGSVKYTPDPGTLLNQWHMILATMDASSQVRNIYWDGKLVANDQGGGKTNKTGAFSIGESTVFPGRHFMGGVAEVALWDRALDPTEIAGIYSSASASAGGGKITTTAKVEVGDSNGPVKLRQEEKIALMFLDAIHLIEADCQSQLKRACPMAEVTPRLKFDPMSDGNYLYTIGASGLAWEAHATAKNRGLLGFYFFSRSFPTATATYSPSGTAGVIDTEIGNRSIEGDTFQVR